LAKVGLRVLLPSRQPSRRRMAGGELRLGTVSMYMGAIMHRQLNIKPAEPLITWEHFGMANSAFGNKSSETYLRTWADFFWNFG
jgi:hypothetical protein